MIREHTWVTVLLWLAHILSCFYPLASYGQSFPAYEVTITGVEDPELIAQLKEISDTFSVKEKTLPRLSLLQSRVNKDKELFLKWLRARGYYAVKVTTEIDHDAVPVRVTFRIDKGPAFQTHDHKSLGC